MYRVHSETAAGAQKPGKADHFHCSWPAQEAIMQTEFGAGFDQSSSGISPQDVNGHAGSKKRNTP